jgi:hypothetical protein
MVKIAMQLYVFVAFRFPFCMSATGRPKPARFRPPEPLA